LELPAAELRARVEVATRALDDVRTLMTGVDPLKEPAKFAEREKKALAIFDEIPDVLPLDEPLTDAERAELEAKLEDVPDDETMRQILELAVQILDDPQTPADVREQLAKQDPRKAIAALDRLALLRKVAEEAEAVAAEIEALSEGRDARAPDPAFSPKPKKSNPS
jgi:hypothetical protein